MSSNSGWDTDVLLTYRISFIEVSLWDRHTHCIPPLNFWQFVKNTLHRQENRPRAIENGLLGEDN